MKTIKILSLTENVSNWLNHTSQPRVLHVFDNAWNLLTEHNDVLSFVTQPIGNNPFNMVVEGNVDFAEHLNLEFPISRILAIGETSGADALAGFSM